MEDNQNFKDNKKNPLFIIIIIVVIILGGALYFIFSDSDADNNTSATTTTNATTEATSDTEIKDPSTSKLSGILLDDGKYDYNQFMLSKSDVPEGMTLQSESGTLIGGGTFDSGYARFYQRMTYPEGTSKNYELSLNLTMQGLIAEDTEMIDQFQKEIDTGSGRYHSPFTDYESDSNYVYGPAAWVRTDNAIFFLNSDRMDNWMSCEGADDCEALATTGRSLNSDELQIMEMYKILFEMYTGATQEEWTWSYVGSGNY